MSVPHTMGIQRDGRILVSNTGLTPLSTVMSRLRGDISLVIKISTITEKYGHIKGHIKKAFAAQKIILGGYHDGQDDSFFSRAWTFEAL